MYFLPNNGANAAEIFKTIPPERGCVRRDQRYSTTAPSYIPIPTYRKHFPLKTASILISSNCVFSSPARTRISAATCSGIRVDKKYHYSLSVDARQVNLTERTLTRVHRQRPVPRSTRANPALDPLRRAAEACQLKCHRCCELRCAVWAQSFIILHFLATGCTE